MPGITDLITNAVKKVSPANQLADQLQQGLPAPPPPVAGGPPPPAGTGGLAPGALLVGRSPEVIQENIRTLMAGGMDEQSAMRRALELARPGLAQPAPLPKEAMSPENAMAEQEWADRPKVPLDSPFFGR